MTRETLARSTPQEEVVKSAGLTARLPFGCAQGKISRELGTHFEDDKNNFTPMRKLVQVVCYVEKIGQGGERQWIGISGEWLERRGGCGASPGRAEAELAREGRQSGVEFRRGLIPQARLSPRLD
jgi:hypothetical protein